MNMSFAMTTQQVRAGTKDVTRRMGWKKAKPGQVCTAIEKGQGLKKGEKIVPIRQIRIVSAYQEQLRRMIDEPVYGKHECIREGFPNLTPFEFVAMFCAANNCEPTDYPMRIEFEYLPEEPQ